MCQHICTQRGTQKGMASKSESWNLTRQEKAGQDERKSAKNYYKSSKILYFQQTSLRGQKEQRYWVTILQHCHHLRHLLHQDQALPRDCMFEDHPGSLRQAINELLLPSLEPIWNHLIQVGILGSKKSWQAINKLVCHLRWLIQVDNVHPRFQITGTYLNQSDSSLRLISSKFGSTLIQLAEWRASR